MAYNQRRVRLPSLGCYDYHLVCTSASDLSYN